LTESDIDAQIKSYLARKENETHEGFLGWVEERHKGFQDATEDDSVDAIEKSAKKDAQKDILTD
jgi:hypothetical protein